MRTTQFLMRMTSLKKKKQSANIYLVQFILQENIDQETFQIHSLVLDPLPKNGTTFHSLSGKREENKLCCHNKLMEQKT